MYGCQDNKIQKKGYLYLWVDTEDQPFCTDTFINQLSGITITKERNILMCCGSVQTIDEYTTQYGKFYFDIEYEESPGVTIYASNDFLIQKIIRAVEMSPLYSILLNT